VRPEAYIRADKRVTYLVEHRDIVVIGASAGGLEALQEILGGLPTDLQAAVMIVLHTANHAQSLLPQILERAGKLPVIHPRDGVRIERGRVYIAPPGLHMIVEDGFLRVLQGPRENLHRPAIDPLFRSAAAAYGARVIGVILTGMLDDGTAGLMVVSASGGTAIVQNPETALYPGMPRSALNHVPNAQVANLQDIPALLLQLISSPLPAGTSRPANTLLAAAKETRIAELDMNEIAGEERLGKPSPFGCPDCGGVLWEIEQKGFLRFRCRVGHALTAEYLGAEQRHAVETALWEALRALEESASLYRRMAARASRSDHNLPAQLYRERASNTEANSRVLRDFLLRVNTVENSDPQAPPHSLAESPGSTALHDLSDHPAR
jgi:two-component system, chemotaxis family, protein-glutamate methylesterase/glutaminase